MPCRTSWTTGRQVVISSKSTTSSSLRREGLRSTSIQTEVSTRTTRLLSVWRRILAHDRKIAFPDAGSRKVQDVTGLRSTHELAHRPLDRPRVGPLAAHLQRLLQQ